MEKEPSKKPKRSQRSLVAGKLSYKAKIKRTPSENLPLLDSRENPPKWEDLVRNPLPVEIEIGPGKGAFLLQAAQQRTNTFFIGVEASPPFAAYAASRIKKAGIRNAVIVLDDAKLFLEDCVPCSSITAIHIYFPDPWPKKRHRKRRFFRPGTPELLFRSMVNQGLLFVSTDSRAYFGEILALLGTFPGFKRRVSLEREGVIPPSRAFAPTNFEKKLKARGKRIFRTVWEKTLP